MSANRSAFRRGMAAFYDGYDADIAALMGASGKTFFVCNRTGGGGVDDVNHGTFDAPFATIDYAIGSCVASRGDLILVKQGHAESISGASAITVDIAGITIRAMGRGQQRASITWATAATTILVSAAAVVIENFRLIAGIADVVSGIIVSAAGCTVSNNTFRDSATDLNFLTPVKVTSTTDNTADHLHLIGNRWISADAASLQLLNAASTILGLIVEGNMVVHEGTDSALVKFATGKLMKQAWIVGNFLAHKMTANELLVNNDGSTNTGIIAHNRVGHADVTGAHDLGIDGLGCRVFDNLSVSTDALSGVVLPAIDVNL